VAKTICPTFARQHIATVPGQWVLALGAVGLPGFRELGTRLDYGFVLSHFRYERLHIYSSCPLLHETRLPSRDTHQRRGTTLIAPQGFYPTDENLVLAVLNVGGGLALPAVRYGGASAASRRPYSLSPSAMAPAKAIIWP